MAWEEIKIWFKIRRDLADVVSGEVLFPRQPKMMALVLVAVMCMAMGVTAWAEPAAANDNKITISIKSTGADDKNATNETYSAYKIFSVTKTSSVSDPVVTDSNIGQTIDPTTDTGFSYYITTGDKWWDAVSTAYTDAGITYTSSTDAVTGVITTTYFVLTPSADGSRYTVKLADGVTANEDTAKTIAKMLEARKGDIAAEASLTPGTAATVDAGYYMITSSLGSNLILATSSMTITEKNDYPTVEKKVEGAASTDVSIGDTVTFTLTTTVPDEANQSLVLHDSMSTGLTLINNSFQVKAGDTVVAPANYTITYSATSEEGSITDYPADGYVTGTSGTLSGYAFAPASDPALTENLRITFTDAYIQGLATDTTITITYDAKLNDGAVIAGTGNPNTVQLTYSNYTTPESTATVYTYAGALLKYNAAGEDLANASFTAQTTAATPAQMYFIKVADGSATAPTVYRYNSTYTAGTAEATNTITTPASGAIVIYGLDAGNYTLTETVAPDGYNMLQNTVTLPVSATSENLAANKEFKTSNNTTVTFVAGTDDTNTTTYQLSADSILGVENLTGTELPSTGGIGTTIFYIIGAILVIGAGVILVTRRRMKNAQ